MEMNQVKMRKKRKQQQANLATKKIHFMVKNIWILDHHPRCYSEHRSYNSGEG